ncbi:MAG: type IV pilus assembly protein PilM [Planctomycetota bacterium]
MANSNACWGIEVGAGGIKAVKLVLDGEGVRVADFAVQAHKRVLSTPELNADDAIRIAMGAFVNQYDLGKARVAVSVPGHAAFARFAKLPPVEPKQVPKIVQFEAEQQIPFSLDEVEWDFQTFRSPESPDVEVGIFAATKQRIRDQLQLYDDFGLVPDIVTLSPLAAYNAMAYDWVFDERTAGTVIVDVGTTSTDIIIAEAGRVWVRTFPLGGHNFTQAIVDQFSVSYSKAEVIKRDVQKSKSARHVLQAMRPVFADLGQEIQRSIGYYQSLHSDSDLQRVVGVGATFKLPGIRKSLQQQLQLSVLPVEEFKRAKIDGPQAATLGESASQLMTAYGLALQGLDFATLEANLMPAAIVREAVWRRKTPWFAAAAGIAVVAGGAMFIRPFLDRAAVDAYPEPPIIRQVLNIGEGLKREASDVTGSQAIDRTASNLVALAEGRDIFPHLVDDLSLMLEYAEELNREDGPNQVDSPVIQIEAVATEYVPPPQPDPTRFDEPQGPSVPQIRVVVRAFTDRPDAAESFIVSSIDSWLRQNEGIREGVPYKIVVDGSTWVARRQVTGAQMRGAGGGGELEPPSGGSEIEPPSRERGRQASPPGRRAQQTPGRPGRAAPPRQVTGSGGTVGSGGPRAGRPGQGLGAPGSTDLANRYPIPRPEPTLPDDATRLYFEATWTLHLLDEDERRGGGS